MKQVQIEVVIKVSAKRKDSDYSDVALAHIERRERSELEPDMVLGRTRDLTADALNRAATLLAKEIELAKERILRETH